MTDGTYRTLMFADTEGQAEETHVGFFDNNVVGLMRNSQMSPTHPRVEEYIYDKLRWDEPLRLVPLVFVDRIAQLRRDNEYTRQAVVKLPAYEYARVSPDSRFYRNVFRMAEDEFGPVVLELSIKVPTRGEQDAADRVFSEFQTLVRSDAPIEKLQITYADRESERAASANLLNDILAMRVDVSVEKSEDPGGVDVIAVTDFSAAQGIRRAYEQLRPEIDRALGSGE
jgi:hypothetical protein